MIHFLEIGMYVDKIYDKLEAWLNAIILKLPNFLLAMLVLFGFYYLAKIVSALVLKLLKKKMDNISVRRIIKKMVFMVIFLVGFFIALGILDLDKALTSILAGAGVVALAIGLALQGTLNNTFSGVLLSFMPRIRINDYIETSSHNGFVEEISLRNFVLRRPDNHIVVMPNSLIVDEPFVNYSLTERSRITVKCGVGYSSSLRNVKEMVTKLMAEHFPQKDGEKVEFYWLEFGDSSINFMTRFYIDYTKPSQMFTQQSEAIMLIKEVFDKNDINIPFPIRTLMMDTKVEIAKEES
ncbi:mechanosensitive ion channel family protein [Sediminibacter sp. Hel_I_10]|uniref:mechanosensitive ion channel family protein n=1 Tax=Sediminibacter sp. Hel_I_10 TaxID=1392490 RepID=UPI00068ED5E8|nr:mechanosensitive ion channel family protein [Sediminibacter sp. Hel_I_10]